MMTVGAEWIDESQDHSDESVPGEVVTDSTRAQRIETSCQLVYDAEQNLHVRVGSDLKIRREVQRRSKKRSFGKTPACHRRYRLDIPHVQNDLFNSTPRCVD